MKQMIEHTEGDKTFLVGDVVWYKVHHRHGHSWREAQITEIFERSNGTVIFELWTLETGSVAHRTPDVVETEDPEGT